MRPAPISPTRICPLTGVGIRSSLSVLPLSLQGRGSKVRVRIQRASFARDSRFCLCAADVRLPSDFSSRRSFSPARARACTWSGLRSFSTAAPSACGFSRSDRPHDAFLVYVVACRSVDSGCCGAKRERISMADFRGRSEFIPLVVVSGRLCTIGSFVPSKTVFCFVRNLTPNPFPSGKGNKMERAAARHRSAAPLNRNSTENPDGAG